MEEKRFTASGIPVYAYRNPALHGFCLSLYALAGSLYETEGQSGETHFVEHIVFRNINRRMKGGLYPLLDRCGLSFNAETYKEFVQFYIVGATEHFADAVTVFSHLFDEIDLPRAEIDPELLEKKQGLADVLKYSLIVVSTVPILCAYPFVQKYFVKGVMIGSLKG